MLFQITLMLFLSTYRKIFLTALGNPAAAFGISGAKQGISQGLHSKRGHPIIMITFPYPQLNVNKKERTGDYILFFHIFAEKNII